jgi:hypothetical protein
MKAVRKLGTFAGIGTGLALLVSPAVAETVTLSCRSDAAPATWTFRIDYATGLIEELGASGAAIRSAKASVNANTIAWSVDNAGSYITGDNVTHAVNQHWEGRIDRLSGAGYTQAYDSDNQYTGAAIAMPFNCRHATQKF